MKRVLCVVSSLNTGGAETFLMKVLRSIDKTKYILDFIVSAPGVYDDEVKQLGGTIYTVPLRTEYPIETFLEIRSIVKLNGYQYFLKLCDTPIGVTDLLAAKLGGANRISVRSCNASSNTSIKKELLYSFLRPLFNGLSDCKIAPSDLAAVYTFGKKTFQKGQVKKLKNGVDLKVFNFDENGRKYVRDEFSVSDKTVLVGHIGRFNQQKNHEFLLKVFAEYHLMNPDSKLLLVGTGELLEQTKEVVELHHLSDYVIFAGVRRDIPQVLSAIDVFLLPSFYEGMPNTVIEAQTTGLNCIVSDRVTREANVTGLVKYVPIDSPQKWCENILDCDIKQSRVNFFNDKLYNEYGIESTVDTFVSYVFEEM